MNIYKAAPALLALALTTTLSACGGDTKDSSKSESTPTTFDVAGTVSMVLYRPNASQGSPCALSEPGYSDIAAGTQVTIYDASGAAVALGQLMGGKYSSLHCDFPIVVNDVPIQKGSNVYSIEVSHRGKVQFTQDTADDVELSIG